MSTLKETEVPQKASPCVMVIYGASGDLTKRKLLPALANLAQEGLLSRQFAIIGFSFDQMTTDAFREKLSTEMKEFAPESLNDELWKWFLERIYYVHGDFNDSSAYQRLKDQVAAVEKEHNTQGNRFHYLAVAPAFFSTIVRKLGEAGLTKETNGNWTRVIVEKPFGHDLESAIQLNKELKEILGEKQIYRIDHYLGKETVQNVMVFRFANSIIEPLWNRTYIDHVQITAAETVGVELQMPTPEEVLQNMVRGQYGEGAIDNEKVPAYRSEPNVSPTSNTETFVALKLKIDNWRWGDVPFYLRTGKRLGKRVTEIAIRFRRTPFMLFRKTPIKDPRTNQLVIHIQPDEGISLRFGAKVPGSIMKLGLVNMDFDYARDFGASHSTGYERLLYDCMVGDATLFQRADMVEAGWSVIQPLLDVWKALPARGFPNYPSGSWGPKEADDLLERDGRAWRNIETEEFAARNTAATSTKKS